MNRKVREAVKRMEKELILHGAGSMSTQFAQFIEDLWTLVAHVKKSERRKRE